MKNHMGGVFVFVAIVVVVTNDSAKICKKNLLRLVLQQLYTQFAQLWQLPTYLPSSYAKSQNDKAAAAANDFFVFSSLGSSDFLNFSSSDPSPLFSSLLLPLSRRTESST